MHSALLFEGVGRRSSAELSRPYPIAYGDFSAQEQTSSDTQAETLIVLEASRQPVRSTLCVILSALLKPATKAKERTVGGKLETLKSYATHSEFLGSPVSRRTLLQSISAAILAPATSRSGLASAKLTDASAQKERPLRIDQKFVLFPINGESLSRRVRLLKDGQVLRSFTASLGLPAQWWAHLDVSEWRGQSLTLSIEPDNTPAPIPEMEIAGRGASETDNSELIAAVRTSREIWSPETLYREPLRPQFHFSSRRGWNNDPNGLVYHNGQYHLFYQHNPYGVRWGNLHWGHAISSDLVHWRELPIALYPREGATNLFAGGRVNLIDGDFPFSGSGVVDHENTSGWGRNGRPPMVIVFTSTGRGECIAYSNDNGTTWTEFEGNPIIRHELDGRDSKLFWHSQSGQWVIVVYSERPGEDPAAPRRSGFAFFTSPDLKSWQERSWIEGFYECPDLFALPIDGDLNRMKWVLSCVPGYYYIGEFDGSRFTPESPRLPGPSGGGQNPTGYNAPPFNAAQTFNNHPRGYVVQVAWGVVTTAGEPFTQMMTFPTTLSLRTTSDGVRLCREPVDAIRSLRTRTYDFPASVLTPSPLLSELEGDAWDIEVGFRIGELSPVLLSIGGDEYQYHVGSQTLRGPRGSLVVPLTGDNLRLRILVDRTTVEIFGDLGQAYGIFSRTNPGGNAALALRTWGAYPDGLRVERLSVHSLRSAWTA